MRKASLFLALFAVLPAGAGEFDGEARLGILDPYVTPRGGVAHTIPIPLPPGPGGYTPTLNLVHTGTRDSWIGSGWDLDLPWIEADPRFAHQYAAVGYPPQCVSSLHGRLHYQSFVADRILYLPERVLGPRPRYWLLRNLTQWVLEFPNGEIYTFGSAESTWRWWATMGQDRNGNSWQVEYQTYESDFRRSRAYPVRLTYGHRVTTTVEFRLRDYPDAEVPGDTRYRFLRSDALKLLDKLEVFFNGHLLRRLEFQYENLSNGSRMLHEIRTTGFTVDGQATPAPTVTISYNGARDYGPRDPIETTGYSNVWPAPPAQPNRINRGLWREIDDDTRLESLASYSTCLMLDLTGDGRDDLVTSPSGDTELANQDAPDISRAASWSVHVRQPDGSFHVQNWAAPVTFLSYQENYSEIQYLFRDIKGYARGRSMEIAQKISLTDMNGDARPDLVVAHDEITLGGRRVFFRVYLNTGSGFSSPRDWAIPAAFVPATTLAWEVTEGTFHETKMNGISAILQTLLDLDGDGFVDLVRGGNPNRDITGYLWEEDFWVGGKWTVAFGTGSGFRDAVAWDWEGPLYETVSFVHPSSLHSDDTSRYWYTVSKVSVRLVDMNGDGAPELCWQRPYSSLSNPLRVGSPTSDGLFINLRNGSSLFDSKIFPTLGESLGIENPVLGPVPSSVYVALGLSPFGIFFTVGVTIGGSPNLTITEGAMTTKEVVDLDGDRLPDFLIIDTQVTDLGGRPVQTSAWRWRRGRGFLDPGPETRTIPGTGAAFRDFPERWGPKGGEIRPNEKRRGSDLILKEDAAYAHSMLGHADGRVVRVRMALEPELEFRESYRYRTGGSSVYQEGAVLPRYEPETQGAWTLPYFAPNTIQKIDFGTGTQVEYAYSSSMAFDHHSRLNRPFPVVTSVALGGSPFTLSYEDGLFDAARQEFRGFAKVTIERPDRSCHVRKFLQGIWSQGLISEETLDGGWKREYAYQYRSIGDGRVRHYAVRREKETLYGATREAAVGTEFLDYDDYGNLLKSRRWASHDPDAELTTQISYYYSSGDRGWLYIVTEPKRILRYAATILGDEVHERALPLLLLDAKRDRVRSLGSLTEYRTTFLYDGLGRLTSTTNPRGHTTRYEHYEDWGPVIRTTNALGHVLETTYYGANATERLGPAGSIAAEKNVNGLRVLTSRDGLGRLTRAWAPEDPYGPDTTTRYDDASTPRVITEQVSVAPSTVGSYTQETRIDGFGRKVFFTMNSGKRTQQWKYDAMGRIYEESLPIDGAVGVPWLKREFDRLGRLLEVKRPDGTYRLTRYDANEETRTDEENHRKVLLQGLYGPLEVREWASTEPIVATYRFNGIGQLTEIHDAEGGEILYEYDTRQLLVRTHVGKSVWTYKRDGNGNVVRRTDPRGRVTQIEYDALDRISRTVRSDGSEGLFSYDTLPDELPPQDDREPVYDNDGFLKGGYLRGKLVRVVDPTGTQTFGYDPYGRRVHWIRRIDGEVYHTSYAHTAHGVTYATRYPDDEVVSSELTALGELKTLGDYVRDAAYDARGHLLRIEYGNSIVQTWEYDRGSRGHQRLKKTRVSRGKNSASLEYTYYRDGEIRTVQEHDPEIARKGSPLVVISGDSTWEYHYDGLHRLVRAKRGSAFIEGYEYGGAGTIRVKGSWVFDRNRALRSGTVFETYEHDLAGNLTRITPGDTEIDGTRGRTIEMEYDDENRLTYRRDEKGELRFTYDALGQRVRTTTALEIFPHYELVGKDPLKRYSLGSIRIASRKSRLEYVHRDHLGSTRWMTDRTGAFLRTAWYEPYGKRRGGGAAGESQWFSDRKEDRTDLIDLGARSYDPTLGRFLSLDPAILQKEKLRLADPTSLNLYLYARANPVRFIDPDGYQPAPAQPKVLIVVPSQGDDFAAFQLSARAINRQVYGGKALIVQSVLAKDGSATFQRPDGKPFVFAKGANYATVITISHSGYDGPNMAYGLVSRYELTENQPWAREAGDDSRLSSVATAFWGAVGESLAPNGKIIQLGCNQGDGDEEAGYASYTRLTSRAAGRTAYGSIDYFGAGDERETVPFVRRIENTHPRGTPPPAPFVRETEP